jgi:hypothetical protein
MAKSERFWAVCFLLFLAALCAFFEFYPAIEQGRIWVSEDVYAGKSCDCWCILNARPWYSRFNYWFWFWIMAVPALIFSVRPDAPKWQSALWDRDCADIADGASLAFTLFFGWIYAIIYTGWWVIVWRQFHHRKIWRVPEKFKSDVLTVAVFHISRILSMAVFILLCLSAFALAILYVLQALHILK